jgi:hypothetical protein
MLIKQEIAEKIIQRVKDHLTQQHRNSNNSITIKMIASKHSCKVLHQQATKKMKRVKKPSPPLRASQGTTSKKHTLSPNI